MNAFTPDDLSAYAGPSGDSYDPMPAPTIVQDADAFSSAPTADLDAEAGMLWVGPDPMD